MYVQRFPKINLSWLKQDLVDKRNDVLLTVAAAVTSHSATSELVVATQSFYVHDTLPGEFFSWKTPLYHMHRGVYCGRVPYLLQWTRELFVFQRVYDIAMCYREVSSIWIHRTIVERLSWQTVMTMWSGHYFFRPISKAFRNWRCCSGRCVFCNAWSLAREWENKSNRLTGRPVLRKIRRTYTINVQSRHQTRFVLDKARKLN